MPNSSPPSLFFAERGTSIQGLESTRCPWESFMHENHRHPSHAAAMAVIGTLFFIFGFSMGR